MNINTGHYCKFSIEPPNASHNGTKKACICKGGSQLSRQDCDFGKGRLCIRCWKEKCVLNDWDHDLSKCLNKILDKRKRKISLEERKKINQYNCYKWNLSDIFEIKENRHISIARWKKAGLNTELSDDDNAESLSDATVSDDTLSSSDIIDNLFNEHSTWNLDGIIIVSSDEDEELVDIKESSKKQKK